MAAEFKHLLSCAFLLVLIASYSGFAQRPELVIQTGHSDDVYAIAYSADGLYLVSGGDDHIVKLWNAETGQELRSFGGHTDPIRSVAFSPRGDLIASGTEHDEVKIWDVRGGKELRALKGRAPVAFSPNGRLLATGTEEYQRLVKLWDAATGVEIRSLPGSTLGVETFAFSPEGNLMATAEKLGKTIVLWDTATGRSLRTLTGHKFEITSVAFSPDGKTLVSGGGSFDQQVKLWDVATGKAVRTLDTGVVRYVAFSHDGRIVAASIGGRIRLWNVASGAEIQWPEDSCWGSSGEDPIAFSPDGRSVAVGASWERRIRLCDLVTGKETRGFSAHSSPVNSVAVSPDGRTIASGYKRGGLALWGVAASREFRRLAASGNSDVTSVAFSANSKTLVSGRGSLGSYDNLGNLWDIATGTRLGHDKTKLPEGAKSVAFSPDSKIVGAGSYHSIYLFNATTGDELRVLSLIFPDVEEDVASIAFSPDGKVLASAGDFVDVIRLWDVETGKVIRVLSKGKDQHSAVAFSPDGKILAAGGTRTIKLWDVATGRELHELPGHTFHVVALAFTPDGKTLASGSWDMTIKLWDVATGRELRTIKGHVNHVNAIAFSSDGKILISGGEDAQTKLWDVATGRELATLIAVDGSDWLVVTPDGLFDGSPAAWNQVLWRFDNDTFKYAPVEAYFNDFFYPGLLQDIMQGKRPTPSAGKDLSKTDRRRPTVSVALAQPQSKPGTPLPTRTMTVRVEVIENRDKPQDSSEPASSGARDVRLFRNGSLVKVWRGDVKLDSGGKRTLETTIPIVAGENRLTAYAFNRDNVKSSDASLVITGAESLKRVGTLYILAVGINSYANSQYDLKYAVPDAQVFGEEVQRQQMGLGHYSQVVVIPLFDQDASKANILLALKGLAETQIEALPAGVPESLAKLQRAQPEDGVVIYFSGHGTAQQPRFYLIPHDLGYQGERTSLNALDLERILMHSISDIELEQAFERIDAGQTLLVIDACNSGQALEAEEKRRGPMNSKGLAQLAYEKGMYILTAAQSYQAAIGSAKLGHGYLTFALVEEGLKTAAADTAPKDGQVLLREWLDYATTRVPQIQEQAEEERELVHPKGSKEEKDESQHPRVFYRREIESQPMVIARPPPP